MSANAIANMTPEQMANTPAGMPPPGVIPNLKNPKSIGYIFHIAGSVLMGVMFIMAFLRYYVKIFIRRKITADDWTTLIGILGTCFYYAVCTYAIVSGKFGTHMWDLSIAHIASDNFIIAAFFTNWVTPFVWPFIKTSFFLMYLQLFRPIQWLRYAIYFGLFANWGFYLASVAASLAFTAPAPGQSWQESFAAPRYQNMFYWTIPIAAGSLILDVYIFVLPIVSISGLELTLRKKLGVIAVFATGLVACVASSLSIYFKHILNNNPTDFTYHAMLVMLMALIEMCVGIAANCMPPCARLFKGTGKEASWFGSLFRSLRSGFSKGGSTNSSKLSTPASNWSESRYPKKSMYRNMDDSDSATHELYNIKTGTRTFVHSGRAPSDIESDGIRMEYGITQESK